MVIPLLPYSIRCLLSSITLLHCNVYAAYHSYKSISRGDNLSMLRWMSYWSMIGVLVLLETVFGFLIHSIVPLYPEIKFVILLSVVISPNAAHKIFQDFVIPFVKANALDVYMANALSVAAHYTIIGATYLNIAMIDQSIKLGLADVQALESTRRHMGAFTHELARKIPELKAKNQSAAVA